MKKLLLSLLLFPLLAFAQEKATVRLGLILPLSGPGALWGHHLQAGATLALSQNKNLQIFFEDDHLDAAAAVLAYKKLRATNQINAVLVFGAASAHAVVPLAERDNIVTLVITSDRTPVLNTRYAVRLALDAKPQAIALADYMREKGLKNVALLGSTQEAMLAYLAAFEQEARNRNINIVFKQDYAKGETDFRSQATRIASTDADAIVMSLLPPSLAAFSKQFREQNSKAAFFGFAQSENLSEIKSANGALEGLVFSNVGLTPDFVRQFKETFKETPQSYSGYTFDLATMIASAAHGRELKSAEVAKQLRSLKKFSGACGVYSSNESFSFDLSTQLTQVNHEELKQLQE